MRPPGKQRSSTERFLGELAHLPRHAAEGRAGGGRDRRGRRAGGWKPLEIEKRALRAERVGPSSPFDVTFPQGMIWGVIGCSLGFALSLVQERTRGTLTRLRAAPLSAGHVLAGKALACFTAIVTVEALLFAVGRLGFGVRPASWGLAAAAAVSVAICFVGIMMLVAVLGKTEQAASGLGWAIMMPLTMLGGGMVPLFAMPSWMQAAGTVSPVKWSILALEGAIWRGFTPAQLAVPCGVLIAVGVAGLVIGAWRFAAAERVGRADVATLELFTTSSRPADPLAEVGRSPHRLRGNPGAPPRRPSPYIAFRTRTLRGCAPVTRGREARDASGGVCVRARPAGPRAH